MSNIGNTLYSMSFSLKMILLYSHFIPCAADAETIDMSVPMLRSVVTPIATK